jgi:hypothetical protein
MNVPQFQQKMYLIFIIGNLIVSCASSLAYVRSRGLRGEVRGRTYYDSIDDAMNAGNYEIVLASGIHDAIDLRYKSNVRIVGEENSVVSGGIEIPPSMFEINPILTKAAGIEVYTAKNISSKVTNIQQIEESGCVHGCAGVPTGVTFGETNMVLARWPNLNRTTDRNVYFHASKEFTCDVGCIALDRTNITNRILAWGNEKNAFIHGYFEWDWADCYRKIESVKADMSTLNVSLVSSDLTPKSNLRFYGTNILSELDAPGEYYVDVDDDLIHIIPPSSMSNLKPNQWSEGPIFGLKPNVVDISHTYNITLENLNVLHGVVGILGDNVSSSIIRDISVEFQSENGIMITNSKDTSLDTCSVSYTGCGAVRAHGGDAKTLSKGNLVVNRCNVTKFALYKRTYEAVRLLKLR